MVNVTEIKRKLCLIGDWAVGKTALVRRFVLDTFSDEYISTIGTKVVKKRIKFKKGENEIIDLTLIIWDIMGQISFRKLLHPTYLKGAKGALLICDLTRKETLEHLDDWIDSLYVEGRVMPSVFVANKHDREDQIDFGVDELEKIASAYDSPFFLASAKTGENVENAFRALGDKILEDLMVNSPSVTPSEKPKIPETVTI